MFKANLSRALFAALAVATSYHGPVARFMPTPSMKVHEHSYGMSKHRRASFDQRQESAMKRRRAFIETYNDNPMNFVPGDVGRVLYRDYDTQRDMEAAAADWIGKYNNRAPKAARIEWPRIPREIPA